MKGLTLNQWLSIFMAGYLVYSIQQVHKAAQAHMIKISCFMQTFCQTPLHLTSSLALPVVILKD